LQRKLIKYSKSTTKKALTGTNKRFDLRAFGPFQKMPHLVVPQIKPLGERSVHENGDVHEGDAIGDYRSAAVSMLNVCNVLEVQVAPGSDLRGC
jgi:hypothetical protein